MRKFYTPRGDRTVRRLGALMLLAICVGPIYGKDSSCKLSVLLNRTVTEHWQGWRLMQLSDLRSDDQNLWSKKWGSLCPGLASGHFLNSESTAYALSLINPKEQKQVVILAKPDSHGGFTTQTISPPSRVAAFAVIHTLPPGEYSEVEDGRTIGTKLDSIGVEVIEAGMDMFYEEHGTFHSLVLSE